MPNLGTLGYLRSSQLAALTLVEARDDWFTGDSISVVETFDDFWTKIVKGCGDVKAIRIVKGLVGRTHSSCVPAKCLRPNSRESGIVQVVAAIDERESKVDVVLSAEDGTSEKKVATIEAGQMLGRVDESGVDEAG